MTIDYLKHITKEQINELPMHEYRGKIIVIETFEGALKAIALLLKEKILGFDTETRPSFQKGEVYQVSLLQLATEDCAYLFRLNKIPFPKELTQILSNANIIKAGVGIRDDIKGFQKLHAFEPQGFVDLSHEAGNLGFTSFGLRALTGIFLGERLSKAAKVTNWENMHLTPAQIKYAASDAYVGLKIFEKIMELKKA